MLKEIPLKNNNKKRKNVERIPFKKRRNKWENKRKRNASDVIGSWRQFDH